MNRQDMSCCGGSFALSANTIPTLASAVKTFRAEHIGCNTQAERFVISISAAFSKKSAPLRPVQSIGLPVLHTGKSYKV